MRKPEQGIGEVIPAYDGNVSAKMVWNEQRLAEFARAADLRTKIYIKAGNAQPELNRTENLGEILAWKRLSNPMELFRTALDRDGFVESEHSLDTGTANVLINHHRLTHAISQSHGGKFDEELFVQRCNSLTRRGIVNALAREKCLMTAMSLAGLTMEASIFGALGGFAYLGYKGIFSDLLFTRPEHFRLFNYQMLSSYPAYSAAYLIEGFLSLVATFVAVRWTKITLSTPIDNPPYFTSLQDILNPAKHLKDFAAGYLYLSTKGRKIVDYQA